MGLDVHRLEVEVAGAHGFGCGDRQLFEELLSEIIVPLEEIIHQHPPLLPYNPLHLRSSSLLPHLLRLSLLFLPQLLH